MKSSSHSIGIYSENGHVKLIVKKRHSAKDHVESEDIYHTQAFSVWQWTDKQDELFDWSMHSKWEKRH